MTDMKKTAKDKAPAKQKKLQLNKETLKDLNARDSGKMKGGAAARGGDAAMVPTPVGSRAYCY